MSQSRASVALKFERIRSHLNEAALRLWAANEAVSLGYGGVSTVSRATGISRTTIHAGVAELAQPSTSPLEEGRSRRSGGGRKRLTVKDPGLREALNRLVDPVTRGDPESPLRWTSKSTTKLALELTKAKHPVGQRTVCDLLAAEGYSLQSVRKTREGAQHPDRDAQFHHLNAHAQAAIKDGQPVISVDTKKKELVGDFKNAGQEWPKKRTPVQCVCMISSTRSLVKPRLTASMIWLPIKDGSASVSITTPPNSRSKAFAAGGRKWASRFTPRLPA